MSQLGQIQCRLSWVTKAGRLAGVDLGGHLLERLERLGWLGVASLVEEVGAVADHRAVGEPGQRVDRVAAAERSRRSRHEVGQVDVPLSLAWKGLRGSAQPARDPAAGPDEDHLDDVVGSGPAGQLEIGPLVQDREGHVVELRLDARLPLELGEPGTARRPRRRG